MKKIVTLQQSIMAEDEKYAAAIREKNRKRGLLMVNLIGSPGCGKTTLLEKTAELGGFTFAVIEGDLATDRDAARLAEWDIPVVQINTSGGCHLEANIVQKAMESLPLDSVDVLFIENVGNLVCPAEFDLGEDFKVALLSTPEGADKPLKYPYLFTSSQAVLLTKTDLLPHLSFDMEMFTGDVKKLNPEAPLLLLNASSGEGYDRWISLVQERVREKRAHDR